MRELYTFYTYEHNSNLSKQLHGKYILGQNLSVRPQNKLLWDIFSEKRCWEQQGYQKEFFGWQKEDFCNMKGQLRVLWVWNSAWQGKDN